MKNKIILIFLFILISVSAFAQDPKPAPSQSNGVAVIELFTSQGDINSPPADKLLSDIISDAKKRNVSVYCLSMHVDFWNRYGWNDPFSSLKYTKRLMNYTSVLGMKETYTPFMIMNGRNMLPVKDSKKTFELINSEIQKNAVYHPEFTYQVFDDTLDVSYKLNPSVSGKKNNSCYVNVAIVEAGLVTQVTKGDNEGKSLTNDNVTRRFFTADITAEKGLVRVPLNKFKPGSNKTVILFIQDKKTRAVQGAAASPFK